MAETKWHREKRKIISKVVYEAEGEIFHPVRVVTHEVDQPRSKRVVQIDKPRDLQFPQDVTGVRLLAKVLEQGDAVDILTAGVQDVRPAHMAGLASRIHPTTSTAPRAERSTPGEAAGPSQMQDAMRVLLLLAMSIRDVGVTKVMYKGIDLRLFLPTIVTWARDGQLVVVSELPPETWGEPDPEREDRLAVISMWNSVLASRTPVKLARSAPSPKPSGI